MVSSFFVKILLLQFIVIGIIIWVLKGILDKILTEQAVKRFNSYAQEKRPQSSKQIRIVSHKNLNQKVKLEILRIAIDYFGDDVRPSFEVNRKIWGGLMISLANDMIDCSLSDRLRQAFPSLGHK